MTCEEFLQSNGVGQNSTRAERAAVVGHLMTCGGCLKLATAMFLHPYGGELTDEAVAYLRKVADDSRERCEEDFADPEFVSVLRSNASQPMPEIVHAVQARVFGDGR